MATWDDVRRIAATLPEAVTSAPSEPVEVRVKGKLFAWERPLRRGDLEALGTDAPGGPILAAHVPDLGVKDALVADESDVYFTTPHFNGYRAILVKLDRIDPQELKELITEAWVARAPKRLAEEYVGR